jgi:hypothetical protein
MMIVARGNNARIKEFFRNKHNELNDGQLESSSDLGGEELNYKHF